VRSSNVSQCSWKSTLSPSSPSSSASARACACTDAPAARSGSAPRNTSRAPGTRSRSAAIARIGVSASSHDQIALVQRITGVEDGVVLPGVSTATLTPNQASAQAATVALTVDATTFDVQQSAVTDRSGNINTFDFSNLNKTATIKPSVFKVSLKLLAAKGYKVIKQSACPAAQTAGSTGTGTGTGTGSGSGSSSTTPIE